MDQSLSYRHSGRFSALGPVASVALGGLAGVPLAVAYGYILVYVPIVGKFTFVLAMVLGGLVGFVAGQVLKKTNTRNHTVATVAGVAAAAIAWYFSWVAWTCALLGEGWAVEASIILALGGFAGWAFPSAPFCESCSAWTEQRTDVARISVSAEKEVQPLAVTGQLAKLAAFGPPAAGAKSWLRLDLHTCPRCEQLNVLDAKRVDVKVEKGTESETVRGIVEGLLLSPAGASEVTALGRARPAA